MQLSPALGSLVNLRWLSARFNSISYIPSSLQRCENLKEIFLDHNTIEEFPRSFFIPHLESLSVRSNRLKHSPMMLSKMTRLATVDLEGNALQYFPVDALKSLTKYVVILSSCTFSNANFMFY